LGAPSARLRGPRRPAPPDRGRRLAARMTSPVFLRSDSLEGAPGALCTPASGVPRPAASPRLAAVPSVVQWTFGHPSDGRAPPTGVLRLDLVYALGRPDRRVWLRSTASCGGGLLVLTSRPEPPFEPSRNRYGAATEPGVSRPVHARGVGWPARADPGSGAKGGLPAPPEPAIVQAMREVVSPFARCWPDLHRSEPGIGPASGRASPICCPHLRRRRRFPRHRRSRARPTSAPSWPPCR